MILALKTDSPIAEITLLFPGGQQKSHYVWEANRQLARDLLTKVADQLAENNVSLKDLTGLIVFAGPGSFTGLRIGITVANAIAYAQNIPIVAKLDDNWLIQGVEALAFGDNDKIALPVYGAGANITKPKK